MIVDEKRCPNTSNYPNVIIPFPSQFFDKAQFEGKKMPLKALLLYSYLLGCCERHEDNIGIYVVLPLKEIASIFRCSRPAASDYIKHLVQSELLTKKRVGRPNYTRFYLKELNRR